MKKPLSITLFLFVFLLSACTKEGMSPSGNSLTLNGAPFEVATVSLLGVSLEGEGHAGLTFTGREGTTAKTLTVDFEYSPAQAVDGTYAFPQTNGARLLNDWLTNFTEFNFSGETNSTNLEKGTVTIKDNGDSNYTVTIDLTMTDGKVFKGTYRGDVQAVFNNG
ncbi:hypothetical protein [Nafulsella turpanensis]|uniref:hypothetical protein n=1 Tax=Nafulsella turpanensis TaxID=1265690 RepID=UPI000346AFC2|nr:hypothetical protein [Nafulsella turpanensis]